MKAFITVIGHDTVGVVAKVAALCCELNINIEDVSQSIMQDMFCMIMMADLTRCNTSLSALSGELEDFGKDRIGRPCHIPYDDHQSITESFFCHRKHRGMKFLFSLFC